MKPLRSGLGLVILILSHARSGDSLLDSFFNQILPRIEERNFTESFYLNSRISLHSLNSSLQNNFPDIDSNLFTSDELTTISNNVSDSSKSLCVLHLQYIIKKLWRNEKETSLLVFIDSFAKPVPSVRNGNVNWHGNRKQCESASIVIESDLKSQSNFGGKYCRAEWNTQIGSDQPFKHFTGVCIPDTCNREDFNHTKAFLERLFFLKISEKSYITEINCRGEDNFRIDSIIFYSVCLGLLFLGISGTIYDQCREKTPESKQTDAKLPILSIFSIPRNWRSLDGKKVPKNDILIIHYIRGIAAALVVLFHTGGGLIIILFMIGVQS